MRDETLIEELKKSVESMESYIATEVEGEEEYLNYHYFMLFGKIIVMEQYNGHTEYNRTFYEYVRLDVCPQPNQFSMMKELPEFEDEVIRAYDDEYCLLERDDVYYITGKGDD